jgi:small subunit ribosomal protein S9
MVTKTTKKEYVEAIGRRKEASARVRLTPASKTEITVNDKAVEELFPVESKQKVIREALSTADIKENYKITAKVSGGGIASQAESIRLGIARALVEINSELRPSLKQAGFLKRDPRVKERKKFGRKKARKSPQWSKR